MPPRKFFISYAHAEAEERELAAWLHDALITNGHAVFIDTSTPPSTRWADEIERRINWCDFLIVLLSAAASVSDMVTEEVRRAHDRYRTHGSPIIIPLRMRYDGDPGYTLSAMLGPIQWAQWESDNDSARILQAILKNGKKGGPDYIGYKRVMITQEMVGMTIAQFTAMEAKAKGGRVMPEQQDFLDQVSRDGGIAVVVRRPEDLP